jgi:hypothetical protein
MTRCIASALKAGNAFYVQNEGPIPFGETLCFTPAVPFAFRALCDIQRCTEGGCENNMCDFLGVDVFFAMDNKDAPYGTVVGSGEGTVAYVNEVQYDGRTIATNSGVDVLPAGETRAVTVNFRCVTLPHANKLLLLFLNLFKIFI